MRPVERCLTSGPGGRVLTNIGVWSPDCQWIVYDTRSDPAGDQFDGSRIEMVHVDTGEVRCLYESRNGAHCGVVTWHPSVFAVAFILGPEHPSSDWTYGASRRQGVIVHCNQPGMAIPLDARDLSPPFTPGALRGGSHVHVFSPDGEWVSFTYEDEILRPNLQENASQDMNQRNVAVAMPVGHLAVSRGHPRNHDGTYFSAVVTRTRAQPRPGSGEILKACEEGWVGSKGYRTATGYWRKRALAFQGHVIDEDERTVVEAFIVDLPERLDVPGAGPLEGTNTRRPFPPRGCVQRRLTRTTHRKYPGLQGPRHWLRSSPDGERIALLMKDDDGLPQLWTVSPRGESLELPVPLEAGVASAYSWAPDGNRLALISDNRVAQLDLVTKTVSYLTERRSGSEKLRPEACVFSPDGKRIAFVVQTQHEAGSRNQIHVVEAIPSTEKAS